MYIYIYISSGQNYCNIILVLLRNTSWMAGFIYVNVLTPLFHAHKIVPLFQWDSILVILKGCSADYPPIPTIKQWTWPHKSDTCAWLILDINTPKTWILGRFAKTKVPICSHMLSGFINVWKLRVQQFKCPDVRWFVDNLFEVFTALCILGIHGNKRWYVFLCFFPHLPGEGC